MANLNGHEAGNGGHGQGEPVNGAGPPLLYSKCSDSAWLDAPRSLIGPACEARRGRVRGATKQVGMQRRRNAERFPSHYTRIGSHRALARCPGGAS